MYKDTHLVALVEAEHCSLSPLERELAHVHVGPRGGAAARLIVILSMGDHCEGRRCSAESYITRGPPPPLCTRTQQQRRHQGQAHHRPHDSSIDIIDIVDTVSTGVDTSILYPRV